MLHLKWWYFKHWKIQFLYFHNPIIFSEHDKNIHKNKKNQNSFYLYTSVPLSNLIKLESPHFIIPVCYQWIIKNYLAKTHKSLIDVYLFEIFFDKSVRLCFWTLLDFSLSILVYYTVSCYRECMAISR